MKPLPRFSDRPYWLLLPAVISIACNDAPSAPAETTQAAPELSPNDLPTPEPPAVLSPPAHSAASPATEQATEATEAAPWPGPFLIVTSSSTGVYQEPSFKRELKIGYLKEGASVGVHPEPVSREGCSAGWYRLVTEGFVCGKHGTTNPKDERVLHRPKQPDLDAVLPYLYARNAHNGTPLYRSVPSKEQVRVYEPYLTKSADKSATDKGAKPPSDAAPAAAAPADKKVQPASAVATADPTLDDATRKAQEDQRRRMDALRAARQAMLGEEAARKLEEQEQVQPAKLDAPSPGPTAESAAEQAAEQPEQEWWQREDAQLHEIKLEELDAQGDDVVARRMIKGFYIAVARQFTWDQRSWYRSTSGAIAPADRFHATTGSDFKGVELDATWKLPIGWVYGWKDSKPTYELDAEGKNPKPNGTVKHFQAINLTGRELDVGKTTYVEAVDGYWVRKRDLRITKPGPPPADVGADERWIDVNLSTQTVVVFRGTEPIYATLVSSGKESTEKEKDHRTPVGEFRIREKHITSTMDGNGSAAGDLPYSIEAVPYVMFYEGSYALHGAFWHRNYGVRMSHGCVNLAPLDAKYVFFNSDPPVPEGWHGSWSSDERPGSRVIVHE